MTPTNSCTCEACVSACKSNTGWFSPGEAEKAAEHLNMQFEKFREQHLVREYWVAGAEEDEDIFVYAPRRDFQQKGFITAKNGDAYARGRCVFLKDDRCTIHLVKPEECAVLSHKYDSNIRKKIVEKWKKVGNPLNRTFGEINDSI